MTEEKQDRDDDNIDYLKRITAFTINISQDLQERIRKAADQNGLSVDEYVERILEQTVLIMIRVRHINKGGP